MLASPWSASRQARRGPQVPLRVQASEIRSRSVQIEFYPHSREEFDQGSVSYDPAENPHEVTGPDALPLKQSPGKIDGNRPATRGRTRKVGNVALHVFNPRGREQRFRQATPGS